MRACSTPFGITEVGTLALSFEPITSDRCSTPFGITEVGTSCTRMRRPGRSGAQRLSASQRSAPSDLTVLLERARKSCSSGPGPSIWVNCGGDQRHESGVRRMDIPARKPYPSDLSDAQWAVLEPLLPPPVPAGRPRTIDL